jgi:hypothetical protein
MFQQSKIKSTKDKDRIIEHSKDNTKLKNNKKQIEWRRNKVGNFCYVEILNLKYQEL